MKVHTIDAGNFKLDGGSMFGVVPKQLWEKLVPADDLNLCSWKMRCLLVEDQQKLILIDTGMGDKQDPKWLSYYHRHGDGDLIQSIRNKGFHEDQITDVVLSHLHFDHCGGAISKTKDGILKPTFINANYWTHSSHWNWAMNPNPREKATFLKENLIPILETGKLKFIDKDSGYFSSNFEFIYVDGHTEKMILPIINVNDTKVIFLADLAPSHAHIHIPYCMSYDVRPLQTMEEKKHIFDKIIEQDWLIVYCHDPYYEASKLELTPKGYKAIHTGNLDTLLIK